MMSLLITAVLARLLSTDDYGLVAISVVVLAMFELLTRVGFAATVIRRERLDRADASTFLWASVALGLVAGLLAVLISGPAAALAGDVEAAPLVALAAVTLPINLAGRIPLGLLSRDLRFRTIAVIEIWGIAVHGVVAVLLAIAGFGALAVVIGQVSRSIVLLVGAFVTARFRPLITFKGSAIREELSFNAAWLGGDLITYASKNSDYWFVGNTLGTGSLGVYYVAYVIPTMLRRRITAIGHEVFYPIASRIQSDRSRLVGAYLRIAGLVGFVVTPAMLGLAAVADLAIDIGFGDKWSEAASPMRLIAVASAMTASVVVGAPIFPAIKRPGVLVTIGLSSLGVLVAGLVVAFRLGTLTAVAGAVLGAATVEVLLMLYLLQRFVDLKVKDFVLAIGPFFLSSLAMLPAVVGVRLIVPTGTNVVVEAAASVVSGTLVYLGVGRLLFSAAFAEQWRESRHLIMPRRASG
jgi:PST family polysaccharide transporter